MFPPDERGKEDPASVPEPSLREREREGEREIETDNAAEKKWNEERISVKLDQILFNCTYLVGMAFFAPSHILVYTFIEMLVQQNSFCSSVEDMFLSGSPVPAEANFFLFNPASSRSIFFVLFYRSKFTQLFFFAVFRLFQL